MSYTLSSKSDDINIKTHGRLFLTRNECEDLVFFDRQHIEINDFFNMVYYVLTNTDLYKNDPRIKFVNIVKKMKKVKGYMKDNKHLQYKEICSLGRIL